MRIHWRLRWLLRMGLAVTILMGSAGFPFQAAYAANGNPATIGPLPAYGTLRVYVQQNEIPRVYGGLGVAIVSTPKGVMTGTAAYRQGTGGELLCYVW